MEEHYPPIEHAKPGIWRQLYGSRWLLLTAPIALIGCWLTVAPFFVEPKADWPSVMNMALPALIPVAYLLPAIWRPANSAGELAAQFAKVTFGAVWPVIGVTTLAFIAARLISGTPTADIPHQAWTGYPFGNALAQHVLITFLFAALGGLALFVFVILPVLVIRRPDVAAQGSHLERVGAASQDADASTSGTQATPRHDGAAPASRITATRLVYLGLPANLLGFILLKIADGRLEVENLIERLTAEFHRTVDYVSRYGFDGDTLLWSLGFVLFIGGLLALLAPILMVIWARVRDRLRSSG